MLRAVLVTDDDLGIVGVGNTGVSRSSGPQEPVRDGGLYEWLSFCS